MPCKRTWETGAFPWIDQTLRQHRACPIGLLRSWARPISETSDFANIEEIAESENINPSYVSRVLRMTLLAPEIVETFEILRSK